MFGAGISAGISAREKPILFLFSVFYGYGRGGTPSLRYGNLRESKNRFYVLTIFSEIEALSFFC